LLHKEVQLHCLEDVLCWMTIINGVGNFQD
jgi:hypothetical protein